MTSKAESAGLILRLYELRREKRMRKAREWFASFQPDSVEDVLTAARGKESPLFRMVTSYWDMAGALVLHGAIDPVMFQDAGSEHLYVFAKLEPYLAGLREASRQPDYLGRLERLIDAVPEGRARVAKLQDRMRSARLAEATKTATPTGAKAGKGERSEAPATREELAGTTR